jgi:hypothetical protein
MILIPERAFSNVFNRADNFLIRRIPADIPQTVKSEGWMDLFYGACLKFPYKQRSSSINIFVNVSQALEGK